MLSECLKSKDAGLAKRVEEMARAQDALVSDAAYALCIRANPTDVSHVTKLFEEVRQKDLSVSCDFSMAVLSSCAQTGNVTLASKLLEHMKPRQQPILMAFIRFYSDAEEFGRACDVYENHLKPLLKSDGGGTRFLDARMERCLMNSALRCGRSDLVQDFLDSSPSDIAKHVTMIRNCAASHDLAGAMNVFQGLRRSGVELNSVVYNTVLDACVECHDLKAAEAWIGQMKLAGTADVVSYNTVIKAYLQNDNCDKARVLMEEMKDKGLKPNHVTFNELVHAIVSRGTAAQRAKVWDLVSEMQAFGMEPNQVTCSILLQNLNSHSRDVDIQRTMKLLDGMTEAMDEVLLSSLVEACVRIGKPDLLASTLKKLQNSEAVAINGSQTFGSLIKAYGRVQDLDGVWRCWKEMRSRHIRPTSITLGCMVEAVVSNGDPEGAYELIQQMQDDERCKEAVNSVIYCSVLKGFTREKRIERVWSVYEEMLRRNVDLSVVMYNTLIDACARCGRMERVPEILENMHRMNIKPNIVTYGTMLKGHCQMGDIQTGFAILQQIKKDTNLKPDEIMYNSLLDGCAQNNLPDEGLQLLQQMQDEGVPPSNYTLSILVKMMNRARRLSSAFTLVHEISKRYGFQPNVHVYANLIQACTACRNITRALSTLEDMVKEGVRPDTRSYTILVRACLSQGHYEQAAALVRSALDLPGKVPSLASSTAVCSSLDHGLVNETLVTLAERGHQEMAVPLLADIKHHKPRVFIQPSTQRRIVSSSLSQEVSQTQKQQRNRETSNGRQYH